MMGSMLGQRRTKTSLLTFTITLALLSAVPSSARAEEKISAEARAHFEAGVALLQDPDGARFEEAYREFLAAYEGSKSPRVLGNVGLCAMKLERDAEAIDAYSRYLDEVPDIDPVEREQIRRDIITLKSGLVRITIKVSPPGSKVLDVRMPVRGEPVTNVYAVSGDEVTIGVRPGRHLLRAKAADRESPPVEVDATPGAVITRSIVVPPPAPPVQLTRPAPSRVLPITTLGVGLAMLAGGGVTGYLSLQKVDAISKECPGGECPVSYDLEGAQRRARTLTTVTDVLLIGGGVLTVGGFAWLLATGSGSSGPREKEKPTTPRASAACTGTGCFATLGGRF